MLMDQFINREFIYHNETINFQTGIFEYHDIFNILLSLQIESKTLHKIISKEEKRKNRHIKVLLNGIQKLNQ